MIKRGKALKPVEFGHKVFLAEKLAWLDYRVSSVGGKSRR